jgi:hypothetical protein
MRSALAAATRDALKMPPLSSADPEDSIPIRPEPLQHAPARQDG